jgi:hypothetical protein
MIAVRLSLVMVVLALVVGAAAYTPAARKWRVI